MQNPDLDCTTVVLPSAGKGKGLFARMDIREGEVVARMLRPRRMKRSEVESYLDQHPLLPHDCVIYVPRSSLVFFDYSWLGARPPKWYRLNHSSQPNCAPRILDNTVPPREQEIAWVATRDVPAFSELAFCYEDAPAEW